VVPLLKSVLYRHFDEVELLLEGEEPDTISWVLAALTPTIKTPLRRMTVEQVEHLLQDHDSQPNSSDNTDPPSTKRKPPTPAVPPDPGADPPPNNKKQRTETSVAPTGAETTETPTSEEPTGGGTIKTERNIFRPPLKSKYRKPELAENTLDSMEALFTNFGSSLRKATGPLPPRDDLIKFDADLHNTELSKNIRWHAWPEEHRPAVLSIIKDYWDAFCAKGIRRLIRGFTFRVNTGTAAPVACKNPRYGPHEAQIITQMTEKLLDNGLVEPALGPWRHKSSSPPKQSRKTYPGTNTLGASAYPTACLT